MKKKFKTFINLFVLFFVVFYPIKSLASSIQCDLFVDNLLSSPADHEWEKVVGDIYLNDFGFLLQYDWDDKNKKSTYRKDDNGNYIVGKIYNLDLAKNLKSGDSIIKLNSKKFTNNQEQKDILKNDNKIKVEFFNQKKGIFTLDLERKEFYLTDAFLQLEDISINSIDQKTGIYEVRFVYNFSKLYKDSYKNFNDIADGTIIYDDNGIVNIEVCIFTEQEFMRSKMIDPGFQIKILNVAKKDNDLFNLHYKLTPYSTKFGNDFNALYLQKNVEGVYGIKNKFNLRAFPFDRQKISLELIDGKYNLDKRNIFVSERAHIFLNEYVKKNEILGWDLIGYELNPFQYQSPFNMKGDFSDGLRLDFIIERKHGYYVFKVIVPIVLILLICWGSVWIEPKEIESRLTITIVCLLSLIAYNFVIDSEMPKLEYLTVMDWIILISYIYATIPNFLSIISFRLLKTNLPMCERIETYSKKYGILSYVTIIFVIVAINANLNPENSSALISWMIGR